MYIAFFVLICIAPVIKINNAIKIRAKAAVKL